MRLVLAMFLVAACGQPARPATQTTKPTATIAPLPTVDAAPPVVVEPTPLPATYDVFAATDWRVGVEHVGDDVRIVLERSTSNGKPIELAGTSRADLSFDANETRVSRGVTMKGSIDGAGNLAASLSDGSHAIKIKLKKVAKADETFTTTFGGTFGDKLRLRAEWKQTKHQATVVWQLLAGPPHTMLGVVNKQTGAFDLTETSQSGEVISRWQGALVSSLTAIGRWSARGKTEPFTLEGASPTWPYASAVTLSGGGRVFPDEAVMRGRAGCLTGTVIPTFADLPSATAQASLNDALRHELGAGVGFHLDECDLLVSYWAETAYTITSAGAGWVGIDVRNYGYMGGAHGIYGSHCTVANTRDGKLVDLANELAASLGKMAPLVRGAILKERNVKGLTEVGFNTEDPKMTTKRKMCVVDDHGAPALAVIYESEWNDADAGMFRFEPVIAKLPAASVRSLFPAGSVGGVVFHP